MGSVVKLRIFEEMKNALTLTAIKVHASNGEREPAAVRADRPGSCPSSVFRTSSHALRLTPVRVNAWTRISATGAGMNRSIPKKSACSQDLGPDRTARAVPVTDYARPALHLFTNTQSQGCNPWEARS